MSPILELIGGVKGYGWGNSSTQLPSSFYSIATVTSTGSAGDIVFNSIPQTYDHLQLRGILRTNDNGSWNNQAMRFNSDTSSSYAVHRLYSEGNGGTALAGGASSIGSINDFMRAGGASLTSGNFGVAVIDILDYRNTNKHKVIRSLNGGDGNGNGWMGLHTGLWTNTNTISTITIYPSGGTAIQHSSFALYGIKAPA